MDTSRIGLDTVRKTDFSLFGRLFLTADATTHFLTHCLFVLSPQMWEKAIEMAKQLVKLHENQMFDFIELSQLLVRQT